LREDLDRALATLPEHHRVVVILSDLEECNYAEIAEMLGIPTGTVRSRLARARSALQKILWEQANERGLRRAGNGETGEQGAEGPNPGAARRALDDEGGRQ
jgi:RNA polymerase sigma-70 factor (ECF subfamily)